MLDGYDKLSTGMAGTAGEYLVLGNLLRIGIQAFKAHGATQAGWDLVAVHGNRAAQLQVKSRQATDGRGFDLKKAEGFDFVILVSLNRGYRYGKTKAIKAAMENDPNAGATDPVFWIVPVEVAAEKLRGGPRSRLFVTDLGDEYKNAWHLIADFLAG